jgi:hypothetical protein
MQVFVDSQFYGAELFPLHAALQIESARKIYVCTCFDLPACTARNLTYALFPTMPAIYMLLRRRATFYRRAQQHDLQCVRDAFLFDLGQLYPDKNLWTFQLVKMLRSIGVDIHNNVSTFPRRLSEFCHVMSDPELVCFNYVRFSDEKTLSFFKILPDVDAANSFRAYLSSCPLQLQNFLLLFLTSGFRWRFFIDSARGKTCPLCSAGFWSWEHFFSCQLCPVGCSVPEVVAMTVLLSWDELTTHVHQAARSWVSLFDANILTITLRDIDALQ